VVSVVVIKASPTLPAGTAGITAPAPATGWSGSARAYLALTKPRIIELLLVTTVPAMILAARGWPRPLIILSTLAGGSLAAGAANTLNCVIDRDIDQRMARTRARPLVRASVSPAAAVRFGIVLGALATLLLGFTVNWLSAGLADGAIVFYVLVYTVGLKRRTPSNIVIGGAAGCFPVLIGWSAVTGRVGWPAAVLFAVVFLWTPPHFWALALRFRDDYARAGVPMLPVVATPLTVVRRILGYSYAMVAVSLLLEPVAGPVYLAVALVAGAVFIVEAHRLHRGVARGQVVKPLRLFHLSISYLSVLFAAAAVGVFLH
jgi:protoheme IX farnesyltransferase